MDLFGRVLWEFGGQAFCWGGCLGGKWPFVVHDVKSDVIERHELEGCG